VTQLEIDPRFNGPPESGNGGYTCGLIAELVGEPAEVTLRQPPPLRRALRFDGGRLWDGEVLVAEGRRAEVDLTPPEPVAFADAVRASERYPGFERHAFPTCFVCGPRREPGHGLRIFAGPVDGRGLFAAPWVVPEGVERAFVWAALDCPGAIAVGFPARGETVLGRLTARVDAVPEPGSRCVVAAWPLGEDGRKLYAGTALYSEAGESLAIAQATWIVPERQLSAWR
jgi:hypothetical protein